MLRSDIELSDASPCRMLHVGMLACEHVKGEGERVACCMSHVARRMLIVACLHVACRMSHAARRMLHASRICKATCKNKITGVTLNIPDACNMRRAPCNMHHATCNLRHTTCNMRRAKKKGVTTLSIHDACNMQHATCNMQHASMQVEEGEGEGASEAIVPTPCTLHVACCTRQGCSASRPFFRVSHVRMFACSHVFMLHVAWCTSHGARQGC